jgi:hypothetical protein
VFDFVADERNEPRYNPGIRRVEKTNWGRLKRFLEGQEELEAERNLPWVKR